MTRLALALAEPRARAADRLDPLRNRLLRAGGASTEAVLVDFLEDDLREAEDALQQITAYAGRVEQVLRDGRAGPNDLMDLVQDVDALDRIDDLATTLASVRRRLAQMASHLPPG